MREIPAPTSAPAAPTAAPPVKETVVVKETEIVAGTPIVKESTKLVESTKVVVVTPTAVPATAVPTTAPVKPSDTAVLALQQEPDTLHPGIGSMMARTIVNSAVFPGCQAQNNKAQWVPMGCESVPTFDNGGAIPL